MSRAFILEFWQKFLRRCDEPLKLPFVIAYAIWYRLARYSYRLALKIFKVVTIYVYPSAAPCPNPYEFISLNPPELEIIIIDKSFDIDNEFPRYTIIMPVLNEAKSITETLLSIEKQTLLPDQIVIIDGGSSDSTIEKINQYKRSSKLDISVLSSSAKNIGIQRNIGIDYARNNTLMNVDAGTVLDKNYAANLLGPFTANKDLDLTCGVHHPKHRYLWSVYLSPAQHFEFHKEPYGACIAYKKDIALKIGKYPEYLTYAGEDTLFCYRYKQVSKKWVFNREAYILWEHPHTFVDTQKKLFNYVKANFEIGLWGYFYSSYLFEPNIGLGWLNQILKKHYSNFLHKQAEIEVYRRKINGLCFIFSRSNIDDINDSDWLRILTLQTIKNNYKVFCVSMNDTRYTHIDQKVPFISTDHTLLELMHYKHFSVPRLQKRYGNFLANSIFIIQFPHSGICTKIAALKKTIKDIVVVYDRLNDLSLPSTANKNEVDIIKCSDIIIVHKKSIDFIDKYLEEGGELSSKLVLVNSDAHRMQKIQEFVASISISKST